MMAFSFRTWAACALMFCTLMIAGCGGGSEVEPGSNDLLTCDVPNVPNSAGTECVAPPPIECDPPTVPNETNDACVVGADPTLPEPVFFPAENQAVLYYNRAAVDAENSPSDPAYDEWLLHTWNNDDCDAYADPDTDWASGRQATGIDPNYGAYWVLDLKTDHGSCHNFIIHQGTDDAGKEMGGGDFKGSLIQDDEKFARMNFTLSGEPTIFEYPIMSLGPQPVEIEGFAAHWLTSDMLLWNAPEGVEMVKLHYSATADLKASLEDGLNGEVIALVPASLNEEQVGLAPHLASMAAWQGDWSVDQAKNLFTTQAVLAGYDQEGKLMAATGIQLANALDQVYTRGEEDANEAALGPVYTESGITAAVWAPTAQQVNLLIYSENKSLTQTLTMSKDDASGVWRYDGDESLDRSLYRYEVNVYHPGTQKLETFEVTDPYSVSVTTNGRFSRFVNLNDEDLKPAGWDSHSVPTIDNPEDAVIYEGHIRDFSVRDLSTPEEYRGKYLAFTEQGTDPVMHLQKLVEAGLTHFHMLPANDIASIDENPASTVNLYSTVGELCRLNRNAPVCDEETDDTVLLDLLNSYDPLAEAGKAQWLTNQLKDMDSFNWGYDPQHFNTPEGSYATDADGVARIVEMRAMNQALHEMGLKVVLDVVYNHTNASGVFPTSVLDKVVPGYYHRYETDTGAIVRETCCDDTEPRNAMMEKLMKDSLLLWTEHYKFDSFRFDIMSQASKDTMVRLREAVQQIDPDNYFYGEGWTRIDRGYEQANQLNIAGTQIGTFNDRIREAIRQGHIFNPDSDQALSDQDRVKMSMAGTLTDYVLNTSGGNATTTASLGGYAEDPADIINYVSKHDNETLWDQLNYTLPDDITLEQRVRAQNIAIGIPLMSQGIPFLQMGGDMLRSKSMDRDSYNSGDWFNYVDFTYNTNNWNVGLPPEEKNAERWEEMGEFIYSPRRDATMADIMFASDVFAELLSIRSQSPLFRLTTMQEVINRVGFHNLGRSQQRGLIAMSIDDGVNAESEVVLNDLDPMVDALMVVVNSGYEEKSITVNTATGFALHPVLMNSVDAVVRGAYFTEESDANGTFTVPALTVAVFVKPQSGGQGYGLSAYATAGAPDVVPFGDTTIFLRGSMNDGGTSDSLSYKGAGIYQVAVTLNGEQTYEFKLASEDWATVKFGAQDGASNLVSQDEEKVLAPSNNDLTFTPARSATYLFSLDASDTSAPILTVENEEPYVGTPVYLRGDFNGWGTENELAYTGARTYQVILSLAAGSYEFKIASDDWATVDFGAVSASEADRTVVLGGDTSLAESNDNLIVHIENAGDYVFTFDVSNAEAPSLRVYNARFFGDTAVFLRGGMNGWGTDNAFSYRGDGTYSVFVTLSAGATEFKVASEDWDAVDLGNPDNEASNDVLLDRPKTLASSNNNLLIDVPAGTYEFIVTGGSLPTLTVVQQ